MVAIEKAIDNFYAENEQSVKTIIDGSDEHLDLILSITKLLNELAASFEQLNNKLHSTLKKISTEDLLNQVMPKLRIVNKSCVTLIGAIRTSYLYRDVRAALKDYTRQYDMFREILYDIHHFRLKKDDEFDGLLKQLNDL